MSSNLELPASSRDYSERVRNIDGCFPALQTLAAELSVPLACLRLDRHGKSNKKTFFGGIAAAKSPSSLQPTEATPCPTDLNLDHGGARSDVDEVGGKTIFAIGSLVKLFINLTYCVLICQKEYEGLLWDTRVFELYNRICEVRNEPRIPKLERNPTLKELLLHKNGYAPMTRLLLAPDGTFMVSESEFLSYAALYSDHFFRVNKLGSFSYSNGNHIFAVLLLEKVTGRNFADIVDDKILTPLGMTRTTLKEDVFNGFVAEGNTAEGHRISASLDASTPTSHLYLSSSLEAASLGSRSCTNDLATLFLELFAAIDDSGRIFSKEIAKYFFGSWTDSAAANPTLCGLYCALDSDIPGSESLNALSRSHTGSFTLGKLEEESVFVHYKGGTLDGFTACIYVSVKHRTSVIVLTNGIGPLDFADYAARLVLQEVFELRPARDILVRVRAEKAAAQEFVSALERSDSNMSEWLDDIEPFAGEYEHVIHKQKIIINPRGDLVFRGDLSCSDPLRAHAHGSKIRIFPGEAYFVVDRRAAWRDLEFHKVRRQNQIFLVDAAGTDYYEKL